MKILLALAIALMLPEISMADSIQEVKARYLDQLMAIEGVVSVGIGRDEEQQTCIVVGIESQQAVSAGTIPKILDSYPVSVKVVGSIQAQ